MPRPRSASPLWPLLLLALGACSQFAPNTPEQVTPHLAPQALTLAVTSEADSGPGTLRHTTQLAGPKSTITFADSVRTITLESELVLDKDLSIAGPVGGSVTISGGGVTRVFHVLPGVSAELRNLHVTGGNGSGRAFDGDGGGILNRGSLTVSDSTLSGNSAPFGGGIFSFGTLRLERSTVSGNSAALMGGGIYSATSSDLTTSSTTLVSSTVSGNTASHSGGGIRNVIGLTRILWSTVTGNRAPRGGGVGSWNDAFARTDVKGSIIVGNTSDGTTANDVDAYDTTTRFNSLGYNLVGAAGNNVNFAREFNQPTDRTNVVVAALKLGALADNGGPSMTHALLAQSVALDAVPTSACDQSVDQRGVSRPQGTHCDIGAYELKVVVDTTPPVITPTVQGTLGGDGWYTGDVLVTWDVVDHESAVTSSAGCDPASVTEDTASVLFTCEAASAGGTASASVTVRRDATPPILSPSVLPNPVPLGASASASANAADGLSGLASASCDPVDTSSAGEKTVTCTAADNAGNSASATASYTVTPATPTALELLDALTVQVRSLGLHQGTERALLAELGAARRSLARGRPTAAVRVLEAFVRTVDALAGRPRVGIPATDAALLKSQAQEVIAAVRARK